MKVLVFIQLLFLSILLPPAPSWAQNNRITDKNTIAWLNYFGTVKLKGKWSVHTEYQFRRSNFVANWQQSLLRLGINRQVSSQLQLRLGYGWIETFNYGDYPLQAAGKRFTEHRIFQMATFTNNAGPAALSHRFMLEQRWIGRYTSPASIKEDEFFFVNRLRYMFRVQAGLKPKTTKGGMPYLAGYNEIFIGFGKNVNENVFDQNRVALLAGYRFGPALRAEAGLFNQTLQLAREINGRNVFQYNTGLIVNAYFSF